MLIILFIYTILILALNQINPQPLSLNHVLVIGVHIFNQSLTQYNFTFRRLAVSYLAEQQSRNVIC